MTIILKQILSITMADDHENASIDLRNGDKVKGVVSLETFEIETLFGIVKIRIEHIKRISVDMFGGGLSNALKLSQGLVLHYSFDDEDYAATGEFRDRTGKGPPLRVQDGAVAKVEGLRGKAASFSQGVLGCVTNPTAGLDAITRSIGFKTRVSPAAQEERRMNIGRTVFVQLMERVPLDDFRSCVNRYKGHYKVQNFSCWDQQMNHHKGLPTLLPPPLSTSLSGVTATPHAYRREMRMGAPWSAP